MTRVAFIAMLERYRDHQPSAVFTTFLMGHSVGGIYCRLGKLLPHPGGTGAYRDRFYVRRVTRTTAAKWEAKYSKWLQEFTTNTTTKRRRGATVAGERSETSSMNGVK